MAYRSSNLVSSGYTTLQVAVWMTVFSAAVSAIGAFLFLNVLIQQDNQNFDSLFVQGTFACFACLTGIMIEILASLAAVTGFIMLFISRNYYSERFRKTVVTGFVVGIIGASLLLVSIVVTVVLSIIGGVMGMVVYPIARFLILFGLFYILQDQGRKNLTMSGFFVGTAGLSIQLFALVALTVASLRSLGQFGGEDDPIFKILVGSVGIGELIILVGYALMGISLISAHRYAVTHEPNKDPEQVEMLARQDQLQQMAQQQLAMSHEIHRLQQHNTNLLEGGVSPVANTALAANTPVLCPTCGQPASYDPQRDVYHCYTCRADVATASPAASPQAAPLPATSPQAGPPPATSPQAGPPPATSPAPSPATSPAPPQIPDQGPVPGSTCPTCGFVVSWDAGRRVYHCGRCMLDLAPPG